MVSVLTNSFGLKHIEVAEDIVSEAFLSALDTWPYKGIPGNPTAWLYTVAKNKLKTQLTRSNTFNKIASEQLNSKLELADIDIEFSDKNISDSQLQMLFAICHPSISAEAQICLALRILCGLGLSEIADALMISKASVHKKIQRAKEKLRSGTVLLHIPSDTEIDTRLQTVLQTIYLLFSEGYYSESNHSIIRKELCIEALNLAYLLLDSPLTNKHPTNALLSLMCFHASRLEARQSDDGTIVLYDDQSRDLWDSELVEKGFYYLQQASKWEITSTYYLEASIAYWHTVENTHPDKWLSILRLYDMLLMASNAPVVALNRLWAFSKVYGNAMAIQEAEKTDLQPNHFYYILLAELYKHTDLLKSAECLKKALNLAKTSREKEMIENKLTRLSP